MYKKYYENLPKIKILITHFSIKIKSTQLLREKIHNFQNYEGIYINTPNLRGLRN